MPPDVFLKNDKHLFRRTPLGGCFWNIWKCSPLLFCYFTKCQKQSPRCVPQVEHCLNYVRLRIFSNRYFPVQGQNLRKQKPEFCYTFCSGINIFLGKHCWGLLLEHLEITSLSFHHFFDAVPQRNSRSNLPEVFLKKDTAEIMSDYGFSLTRIFPYKDGIYDSVLIRENTDNRKPVLWYIFWSGINTFQKNTTGGLFWKIRKCSPLPFSHFTIFPEVIPQGISRSSLPDVFFKKSEHLLRRTHLGDCFCNS